MHLYHSVTSGQLSRLLSLSHQFETPPTRTSLHMLTKLARGRALASTSLSSLIQLILKMLLVLFTTETFSMTPLPAFDVAYLHQPTHKSMYIMIRFSPCSPPLRANTMQRIHLKSMTKSCKRWIPTQISTLHSPALRLFSTTYDTDVPTVTIFTFFTCFSSKFKAPKHSFKS